MNGAEILVECLEREGVDVVFAYPGGCSMPIHQALTKTKKIRTHKSMAIDITQERIKILNKKYKFSGSLAFRDLDVQKGIGTLVTIVLPLKFDTENF